MKWMEKKDTWSKLKEPVSALMSWLVMIIMSMVLRVELGAMKTKE